MTRILHRGLLAAAIALAAFAPTASVSGTIESGANIASEPEWLRMNPFDKVTAAADTGTGGSGGGAENNNNNNTTGGGNNGNPEITNPGPTGGSVSTRNAPLMQLGPSSANLGSNSAPATNGLIDAWGECSWVDNAGTPATAFIPLGTALEWTLFRLNRPQQIAVPTCCRPATVQICSDSYSLDYGRNGDQQNFTANSGLAQATVMCASQAWGISNQTGTCVVDTGGGDCHGGCMGGLEGPGEGEAGGEGEGGGEGPE